MQNENKKFFSKNGFIYLIYGIITVILQIIIINLIYLVNPNYIDTYGLFNLLSPLCNYILPFPILYLAIKQIKKEKIKKTSLNLKTFILYMGISLTLMWIGNICGLIITTLLGGVIQNDIANPVQQLISSSDIWFNILIISIMAPVFEELFFRKFLIDRSIKYGMRVSILLSATIFAFFHGNLNQFFYAFLIGGFFAYVYTKTGKIEYTIILHSFINIMGSVISLIITNSVMHLEISITLFDIIIILIYLIFVAIMFIIAIFGLYNFRGKIFKKIELPLKTIFVNKGMILFMVFFIWVMIKQIIG